MCGTCNKSYIAPSGLNTHWKHSPSCTPSPEEKEAASERSYLILRQSSDPLLNRLKQEAADEEEAEEAEYESAEGGGLVVDMDRAWREGSLSPPPAGRVVPADHLALADTMLGHGGTTITVETGDHASAGGGGGKETVRHSIAASAAAAAQLTAAHPPHVGANITCN